VLPGSTEKPTAWVEGCITGGFVFRDNSIVAYCTFHEAVEAPTWMGIELSEWICVMLAIASYNARRFMLASSNLNSRLQ
jgi:hypothetical protein